MKLLRNLRFLWSVLRKEGAGFDANRNRVDCEVYELLRWILLKLFLQSVANVLLVNPFPLNVV